MRRLPWVKIRKILLYFLAPLLAVGFVLFFVLKIMLGDMSVFLPYGAQIAGLTGEKNYLIIFQNNNEIRPTGGFISSYGILNFKHGGFSFDFADSYKMPNVKNLPPAPAPFNVLIEDPKFKGWYFRDSNFNVDFSVAVQDILKLFAQQSGEKVVDFDGVIGVNFELLEDMIDIYDLELDGRKLTRENLFTVLEFETKNIDTHNIEALENRKNGLGELAHDLIGEMVLSPSKYGELMEVLNTGLDQKKLLLFFADEDLQGVVENNGWGDIFVPDDYDNFIYTNIANIGGRKSDRYILKKHEYFVDFEDHGRGKVRYTLNLQHFGGYSLNSDTYKAYVRIFVPENASVSLPKGYFEDYIFLKPGEKKEISVEYFLPKNITPENFNLDLIKQPGTKDFWEVIVRTTAENVLKSDGFDVRDRLSLWSGYLLEDKHFDFEYIKDEIPPVIVWQKFLQPNLIAVNFSESLDEDTFLNPKNYELKDLNYADDKTDDIEIEKIYFKNNDVMIKTTGINYVLGERYALTLKHLEDLSGNKTIPETLKVTVVQDYLEPVAAPDATE